MEIIIGAAQAGVALATVNPKLSPAEIRAICEDARARVLFIDAASAEHLGDVPIDGVERTIVIDTDLDDWLRQVTLVSRAGWSKSGVISRFLIPPGRPASRRACWCRIARAF